MPGNVQNAVATLTMPVTLSTKFERDSTFPVKVSGYPNGESQRAAQTETAVARWRLGKRLVPAAASELRDFYLARRGPHEAFFFYDPYETNPVFATAPEGDTGKYIVRFDGPMELQVGIARADLDVTLVQVT